MWASRRWHGADAFDPYGSRSTGTLSGGTLTITVPWAELHHTRKLGFAVDSFAADPQGDQASGGSFAPGTPPHWHFEPDIAVRVTSLSARFRPAAPVHGKVFKVAGVTERLSTGEARSASAACSSRLGRAVLAGRHCSWRMPKSSRGKWLKVAIRADGLSRSYSFVIR
jgi:hypothetical protein